MVHSVSRPRQQWLAPHPPPTYVSSRQKPATDCAPPVVAQQVATPAGYRSPSPKPVKDLAPSFAAQQIATPAGYRPTPTLPKPVSTVATVEVARQQADGYATTSKLGRSAPASATQPPAPSLSSTFLANAHNADSQVSAISQEFVP